MRILCVIENLGSGGAQRQLMEIALGLKELGHGITFLTYRPESFFSRILENSGISIHVIIERNYFLRFLKMRKFIRSGRFDSIISFLEASNFICEMSGFPFRKWTLVVGERSSNPRITKSIRLILYRWFHMGADYIVANSHTNIQLVKSVNPLLPLSKCKTIYNIVDFRQWYTNGSYFPRKNGKLQLIIAASHQRLKNAIGLVEAVNLLTEKEKGALQISWYGDRLEEPYFDDSLYEVKEKIVDYRLNDIITFYPATIQLNEKIKEADAVGLFSFYEGFPNVICEAMACAKPVICSRISDLPSILSYNSDLLFDPKNYTSIAKALRYLINLSNDEMISIGKMNEQIALKLFNRDTIVKEYAELIGA
jgi:glycosyltransferase involved in cell wall biosynthesis